MLIDFTAENYKTFDAKTSINMIASKKIKCLDVHCAKVGNKANRTETNLLKTFALFGANSSGKSSLISAIKFMQRALTDDISYSPLRCDSWCKDKAENKTKESGFLIGFSVGDNLYSYEFGAILSTGEVTHECLGRLVANGNTRPIFIRENGGVPVLGKKFNITGDEKKRLNVYAQDVDNHHLFLTLIGTKAYDRDSESYCIREAYNWLTRNIIIESTLTNPPSYSDVELSAISEIMSKFDVGVDKIEELPASYEDTACLPAASRLVFGSEDSNVKFAYNELSHGTQRLFDLSRMLVKNMDDVVYIVDDFGRDFHPLLSEHFLRAFYDKYKAKRVQFMFTTHEDNLLKIYTKKDAKHDKEFPGYSSRDPFKFRRDEIWFVERTFEGVLVYSLERYVDTYDDTLKEYYLDERYGGTPNLGTIWRFDRLDEEKNEEEEAAE